MTKKGKKPAKERPKITRTDAEILKMVKADPNKSNYQIGRELKQLGVSKSDHTVYTRLKQSQYLSMEIDRIRQANFELMSREVVPEALKIHKRVLKNKKIPDEKKKDWVALAEKAEFGIDELKRPPQPPQQVNLVAIQQIIRQAISMPPEDNDVIDVTEN
ncbi:MAG: hypothetical protein HQ536_04000 [Parcubacteria group bacterium]|nr:hypothetical protein [Parcubacteria group bacterium]